jgi:hypothetical protein
MVSLFCEYIVAKVLKGKGKVRGKNKDDETYKCYYMDDDCDGVPEG